MRGEDERDTFFYMREWYIFAHEQHFTMGVSCVMMVLLYNRICIGQAGNCQPAKNIFFSKKSVDKVSMLVYYKDIRTSVRELYKNRTDVTGG